MRPPCRSTIFLHTARPMPCPSYSSAAWARWKASKIWSRSAAGMPMPSSATVDLHPVADLTRGDRDPRDRAGDDVLDRVADQVVEQLAHQRGIGVVRRAAVRPRSAAPAGSVMAVSCSATERAMVVEVDHVDAQLLLARDGGVEQVVDQLVHPVRGGTDPFDLGTGLLRRQRALRLQVVVEQLGPALDDAQRTAQVVCHDPGERLERGALGPVGGDVVVDHDRLSQSRVRHASAAAGR